MVKWAVGDLTLNSTATAFPSVMLSRLVGAMPGVSTHPFADACPLSVFRLKASDIL